MAEIKMKRAIGLTDEKIGIENLNEEVVDYIGRVTDIAKLDDQFWNDFMLGIVLWDITCNYIS